MIAHTHLKKKKYIRTIAPCKATPCTGNTYVSIEINVILLQKVERKSHTVSRFTILRYRSAYSMQSRDSASAATNNARNLFGSVSQSCTIEEQFW